MTHRRLSFEYRLFFLALGAGAPAVIATIVFLAAGDVSKSTAWTLGGVIVAWWLAIATVSKDRFTYSMRTLSNLLGALRDGDFSFRLRMDDHGSLGEVYRQINDIAETLHEQRLGAMEAAALLQKVMSEIDVAIFAFDAAGTLRLINRAGEQLLMMRAEEAIGASAATLGLETYLAGPASSVARATFRGGSGLWTVRRGDFRESGQPHNLLVFSDITRPLREEELRAWQKLVRVLGHEINNSLAPIKSIAESLEDLLGKEPPPPDWQEDVRSGLRIISGRAEALSRFTRAYATLAKLPKPTLRPVDVADWVRRVASMETRLQVRLVPGPQLTIRADADQLDQLLINLVRNAAEACRDTGGGVSVGWKKKSSSLEVWVEDEGPGIANPGNLFVPFFTTKSDGAGIGLVLSRQIAEAHGGTLTLENRLDACGAVACLRLPLGC